MPIKSGKANLEEDYKEAWDKFEKGNVTDRLLQLAFFRKTVGHCRVPAGFTRLNDLGIWVKTQRVDFVSRLDDADGVRYLSGPVVRRKFDNLLKLGFDFRDQRNAKKIQEEGDDPKHLFARGATNK